MSNLVDHASGSQYDDEQRRQAVAIYVLTGSIPRTARETGIPDRTLYDWYRQEWWLQLVDSVRQDKQDELDGQITGVIHRAMERIAEKVDKEDVSLRDLTVSTGIMIDKRAGLRGVPSSFNAAVGAKALANLAEEFARLVSSRRGTVIEAECLPEPEASPGDEE